jgi:hypothetical protein
MFFLGFFIFYAINLYWKTLVVWFSLW